MHSATSSGLSGLVSTMVSCALTQVVIETHSRMGGAKCHTLERPDKQATTKLRAKQETSLTVLCHTYVDIPVDLRFEWSKNVIIVSTYPKFKQLPLAYNEEYGL